MHCPAFFSGKSWAGRDADKEGNLGWETEEKCKEFNSTHVLVCKELQSLAEQQDTRSHHLERGGWRDHVHGAHSAWSRCAGE